MPASPTKYSSPVLTSLACALVSVVATACAAALAPAVTPPATATSRAVAHVIVRVGETATPAGCAVTLTLTDVRDDSRCPVDVSCVWAGDATVVLAVTPDGGQVREVVLQLANETARAAEVSGVRLHLDSLRPDRQADSTIRRDEYRATLSLSRP